MTNYSRCFINPQLCPLCELFNDRCYNDDFLYFNGKFEDAKGVIRNRKSKDKQYNGVYISQLIRYSRTCGAYHDFLDRWLVLTSKLLNQGFLLFQLKLSLTVATMSWLTVMEYLPTNVHGYIPFVVITMRSFPHSWLITRFVERVKRRVPHVE